MKNFFISYNREDRPWAEWIAWQLEEAEYTTVLQAWDFRPGSNFVLEMQQATKEAERTIAVLSPDYLTSLNTQSEWATAFAQDPTSEKGVLLPVRVLECDLTGLLRQIIYIDLVGLEETDARNVLFDGVDRERYKPATPPPFPHSVVERPPFPGILEETGEYVLVISATFFEPNRVQIEAIVAHLKKLTKDARLTLKRIEQRSVKLVLEGSRKGFQRLEALFKSGKLSTELELKVIDIQWLATHPHREGISKMLDVRAQEGREEKSMYDMQEQQENIQKLAYRLTVNHIHMSINTRELKTWETILCHKDEEKNIRRDYTERRVIAVVGAGASESADVPLANNAIEKLKQIMHIDTDVLDDELNRLESVYRLTRDDFETVLMAMGSGVYNARKLRSEIQRMYNYRHPPIFTYEILAHLLKHRFLDAVISFNFDELLDQCIEDEIGPGNYHYVLSDGDCLCVKKDNNTHRYDLPLYIKLHGTAGHKSTLRFTREDYYGLPDDMRNLIADIVKDFPLSLMVIGFGMQSFEFNQLIREKVIRDKSERLEIYNLNNCDTSSQIKDNFQKIKNELDLYPVMVNQSCTLDMALEQLWKHISDLFNPHFKPRHLLRHQLICKLLSSEKAPEIKDKESAYLNDKMVIEIALATAKSKGLVDLTALSEDRCGRSYELYRSITPNCDPLYDICNNLGLQEVGYSRQMMRLFKPPKGDDTGRHAIVPEKQFSEEGISLLHNALQSKLKNRKTINQFNNNEDFFRNTLLDLYKSEEVEVSNIHDITYSKVFSKSYILNSYTALHYHTICLINELKDGDKLLIVAETGEWLIKGIIPDTIKYKDIHIFMIMADLSHEEHIRNIYLDKIKYLKNIPWWTHNRHMTILTRSDQAIKAIYFTRRLRSSSICPVVLTHLEDVNVVFESFIAYWKKSKSAHERSPLIREEFENKKKLFDELNNSIS